MDRCANPECGHDEGFHGEDGLGACDFVLYDESSGEQRFSCPCPRFQPAEPEGQPTEPSRSVMRRVAIQQGRPTPDFSPKAERRAMTNYGLPTGTRYRNYDEVLVPRCTCAYPFPGSVTVDPACPDHGQPPAGVEDGCVAQPTRAEFDAAMDNVRRTPEFREEYERLVQDETAQPPVEYLTITIARSVFDWFLDGKWYEATPNEYHDPLLHISDRCRAAALPKEGE